MGWASGRRKRPRALLVVLLGGADVASGASSEELQPRTLAPQRRAGFGTSFASARSRGAAARREEELKQALAAEAYYRDADAEIPLDTPLANAAAHSRKNWSSALSAKSALLRDVFWVHVPKTGSSFSRTIFSYACGPDSFPYDQVSSALVPKIAGDCSGMRSKLQAGVDHSWFHMPVPPQLQATGRSVVMMLRPPRQRLLSASGHIATCSVRQKPRCMCCAGKWDDWTIQNVGHGDASVQGNSWGWSQGDRQLAVDATKERGLAGYMDVLGRRNALTGCYAKMMNGIGCNEEYQLSADKVQKAADFVEHKASFVGMTGRFEESICLFHAMYGGTLYHFEAKEFVIARGEPREPHDESALGDWEDEEDNVVYAAGSRRFAKDLAAHDEQVRSCMATLKAWVDEDWSDDDYRPSEPLLSSAKAVLPSPSPSSSSLRPADPAPPPAKEHAPATWQEQAAKAAVNKVGYPVATKEEVEAAAEEEEAAEEEAAAEKATAEKAAAEKAAAEKAAAENATDATEEALKAAEAMNEEIKAEAAAGAAKAAAGAAKAAGAAEAAKAAKAAAEAKEAAARGWAGAAESPEKPAPAAKVVPAAEAAAAGPADMPTEGAPARSVRWGAVAAKIKADEEMIMVTAALREAAERRPGSPGRQAGRPHQPVYGSPPPQGAPTTPGSEGAHNPQGAPTTPGQAKQKWQVKINTVRLTGR